MKEPEKIFLVAVPGRRIKDPITLQVLPIEGEWKPETTYWLRRLHDGDVARATPPINVNKSEAKAEHRAPKNKPATSPEKES